MLLRSQEMGLLAAASMGGRRRGRILGNMKLETLESDERNKRIVKIEE